DWHEQQNLLQVVCFRESDGLSGEPGLEVLLHALLRVETDHVQGTLLAELEQVDGGDQIALGLFDPLADDEENLIASGHREPCLRGPPAIRAYPRRSCAAHSLRASRPQCPWLQADRAARRGSPQPSRASSRSRASRRAGRRRCPRLPFRARANRTG